MATIGDDAQEKGREMFDVIPKGNEISPNCQWIKNAERNSCCHWVIHELPDGSEFRALYNGLSYWVKVFLWRVSDQMLINLFDLSSQPEQDENGEDYLPSVSENSIREFLNWRQQEPVTYR